MWLHIDGAFGAWVKISKTHRQLADGLERADSIAVDLHKWMNMPYPIGLTLVSDKVAHYSTFAYGHDAEYLDSIYGKAELDTMTLLSSLALSRGNAGVKAYMLLRAYGKKKYGKLVQKNIDGINYLADLFKHDPLIEITTPVVSNIVCFRYNPGKMSEENLERLNKLIMRELWKSIFGMVSDTTLNGKYTLRACSVNHRTKIEDYDFLFDEIKKIGARLETEI
jgi:glutamate/tyrosine decarboxylase-like PLP-dependent enzyme